MTANGISLKGMTKKDATDALAKNLEQKYKDTTLTVQYNNETYKVNITPVLDYNVSKDVDKSTSLDIAVFSSGAWTGCCLRRFMARKKKSRYILLQSQPKC